VNKQAHLLEFQVFKHTMKIYYVILLTGRRLVYVVEVGVAQQ